MIMIIFKPFFKLIKLYKCKVRVVYIFFIITFQSAYGFGKENVTWGNTKEPFSYVVTWFVVLKEWLKLETQACVAESYWQNAFFSSQNVLIHR